VLATLAAIVNRAMRRVVHTPEQMALTPPAQPNHECAVRM